ncbi:MFS transporter [Vibrio sp. OCN044]|uniref:MFS transporter n=1 Tax=Vibrio tetraodonis subsp. pristinus TaxID=2695891 RepID=A0A6L8LTN1_9VIBR|nr:MFS transporter [Vibrio tetraodonis]MYM59075.1 MFS transporter [Vibrio tetraodonis subsp. pristinus]
MNLSWKNRLGVVTGNTLEYYDIAVFAAISPFIINILSTNGYSDAGMLVWGMFGLRFLLRPFGGLIIGKIADHSGKKTALIITSSLTGLSTLSMALLPLNSEYIAFYLLALQMVQAFSFGGEFPTIINYLMNNSPKVQHARTGSMIVASSIAGVILSLLIVSILQTILSEQEMQSYGWRIPLLIGALNIVVSFWFRFKLPDEINPSVKSNARIKANTLWVKLFSISVTGGAVFYIQNLASSIMSKSTNIPYFSLLNSTFLFVLVIFAGYVTDQLSTTRQTYIKGCLTGVVLYFPLYWLLTNSPLTVSILSMGAITLISAFILTNLASVLADVAKNRTVQLGISYNIALSIFGGLTPLIVEISTSYSASLIGLYAAACTLPGLCATYLHSQQSTPIGRIYSAN